MRMTDPAKIGDNSAAFGQTLRGDIETLLGDEKIVFHYVRWHINDYISGTKEMTLETEGAYMRFLVNLYERGKPFPDDDRVMARVMRLSVRVWRRIRDGLMAVGKIIRKNGCLTNSRFEKERWERADEMRKKALAANTRWHKSPQVSPKFEPNLAETSAKLDAMFAGKINEINEAIKNVHMLTKNPRIQEPEEEKESPPTVPPAGDGAGAKPKRARAAVSEAYTEDFESFWKVYPRSIGKGAAFKSWQRLSLPQKRKAYKALKEQLPKLSADAARPEGNFCPHPATWINQGRFDDEPEAEAVTDSAAAYRDMYANMGVRL